MPSASPTNTLEPPQPLGERMIDEWSLDPSIDFLNHGCFGARPRIVADTQDALRREMEARPIEFLERRRGGLLADAKAAVGAELGMSPDDFGFVTNATGGVNSVLRSLALKPGDEILTTSHVYNAVRQTLRHVTTRAGATFRELELVVPVAGPGAVISTIEPALGERTRLVLVDHVTSPTAVRLPIDRIVAMCDERGIDVLLDGAHAPGMLDLDVASIGAAYYTGNLHKWMSAPMGTAFLWVRPDRQAGIHPPIISHFYDEGLAAEFAWQGTRDITGWLSAPAAIRFLAGHGWDRVRGHNHDLATWAQMHLATRRGVRPSTPADGSMIGSMAAIELPETLRRQYQTPEQLQAVLYDRHRIELPVIPWTDRWAVRVSCHIYNRADQYERLADAVLELA